MSLNTTSSFVFVDVLPSKGQNQSTNKISSTSMVKLWLRYNDFWFGKTNNHHTWILLPLPISTIFP